MNIKSAMKSINPWILVAILALGTIFYWWGYRPSQIKKVCSKKAVEAASNNKVNVIETYDLTYKVCLQQRGL